MVLKLHRITKPVVPATTAPTTHAPRSPQKRGGGTVEGKTITVRMPPNHMQMIEQNMASLECDRSECLKRAIRLQNTALSSWSATLILRNERGEQTTIPVVNDGVPV